MSLFRQIAFLDLAEPACFVDRRRPIRFAPGMTSGNDEKTPAVRQRLRRKLIAWYEKAARELPWRESRDPYRIWISEIMLQQTTVAAVVPYFERFLKQFPDLESLANAQEAEVLKLWEGLGYYSRARNIWKAARKLWEESGGSFPKQASELQKLPGIGRYTAGAIASFAFDQRAPILEANTQRLYSRLLGYAGDPRSADGQRALWRFAEEILPRSSPGRLNQALMELGSQVCTPAEPNCPACPIKTECKAHAEGSQNEIPRLAKRVPLTDVTEAYFAVARNGGFLLRKRTESERWAGLWDFPRFELADEEVEFSASSKQANGRLLETRLVPAARKRLENGLFDLTGVRAELDSLVSVIRHGVTRYRIRLLCFRGEYLSGRPNDRAGVRWIPKAQLSEYPLSTTGRKFADLLVRGESL